MDVGNGVFTALWIAEMNFELKNIYCKWDPRHCASRGQEVKGNKASQVGFDLEINKSLNRLNCMLNLILC